MATAAEKRRLLEGVAYIRTHKKEWDQNYWATARPGHCGTVACLAGHIAITLNPSKPVVKMPWAIFRKKPDVRTYEERQVVNTAISYMDKVRSTSGDRRSDVFTETIGGEEVSMVHVRDRAARLIGGETMVALKNGERNYLFGEDQTLNTIYAHCCVVTGMTRQQLLDELDKIAKRKGWTGKKVDA